MVEAGGLLDKEFGTLDQLVASHAASRPTHTALVHGSVTLDYRGFDVLVDRVAAALQRDGIGRGDVVAVCALSSILYAAIFVGTLRSGAAVAPLAPSATADSLAAMIADANAKLLFLDEPASDVLAPAAASVGARCIALEAEDGKATFARWLAPEGARAEPVAVAPDDPFNIIYSSGTTGQPKGIVQPHAMRWAQFRRVVYDADAVTIISTPLYPNTTLVSFLPTLAAGGTIVLLEKFDASVFLTLAQRHHATHAMLVPVQYRRIMECPDFDRHDLSSFRIKFSTSAPFSPELMTDVLKRWPGGLIEFYGMTEGGGTCMLEAHFHPEKLHTVGHPMEGSDIRLIDEEGGEVEPGGTGEVVGHSASMMAGYHNLPEKTREVEWFSPNGVRFIRTGDVGRLDADGFLVLVDRRKDMIISGGFNIYPSDIEAVLAQHPAIEESAVFGVPSERWGETPIAAVVLRQGMASTAADILAFANERLGKAQRLTDLHLTDSLPRSAIGKILKRDLRLSYAGEERVI